MDLIEPIAERIAFPLLVMKNRHHDMKYLREVATQQYLGIDDRQTLQLDRLRTLLIHAARHCPFYSRRFAAASFLPTSIGSLQDLERIPPLTRTDLQQHLLDLSAGNMPPSDYIDNQTGGSTGSPVKFRVSKDALYHRIARTIRHDRWAGLEPHHRAASIWGYRPELNPRLTLLDRIRNALVFRRVVLDASKLDDQAIRRFIETLLRHKPTTYVAYAGAIFLLARYLSEHGELKYHRPKSIITSAEFLADEQRSLIEQVFACPVFNRYGSREFSVIASECEAHVGLHVAADGLLVEVLRHGAPCPPGVPGEIVITDLYNYATPFIRYRIGDVGMFLDRTCPCGRTLPLMALVGGRVTDFIVTSEGKAVSGAALTIYLIARVHGIAQAQMVQRDREHVTVRIVKGAGFDVSAEAAIASGVEYFLGPRMKHDLVYLDAIPALPSGKYRFSISDIDPLDFL